MTTTIPQITAARPALPSADPVSAASRARRRAWICLVAAFTIWCVLAGSIGVTGWTYRRNATESPPALLNVERGTVFYGSPTATDQMRARPGMTADEGGVV